MAASSGEATSSTATRTSRINSAFSISIRFAELPLRTIARARGHIFSSATSNTVLTLLSAAWIVVVLDQLLFDRILSDPRWA